MDPCRYKNKTAEQWHQEAKTLQIELDIYKPLLLSGSVLLVFAIIWFLVMIYPQRRRELLRQIVKVKKAVKRPIEVSFTIANQTFHCDVKHAPNAQVSTVKESTNGGKTVPPRVRKMGVLEIQERF